MAKMHFHISFDKVVDISPVVATVSEEERFDFHLDRATFKFQNILGKIYKETGLAPTKRTRYSATLNDGSIISIHMCQLAGCSQPERSLNE